MSISKILITLEMCLGLHWLVWAGMVFVGIGDNGLVLFWLVFGNG